MERDTMIGFWVSSKASGIRCIKASPNSAPTDRETNTNTILFSLLSERLIVKTPTRENRLISVTLAIEYINIILQ
jgi:hypothetical protein